MQKILVCPNPNCEFSVEKARFKYIKRGFFVRHHPFRKVPRYRCCHCGRNFSTSTYKDIVYQKRPDINPQIYKLYCSGMTLNRIAEYLRVARTTVYLKFHFLARQCAFINERALEKMTGKFSEVQFDEMESFEHTRLKPLTIALAVGVTAEERKILAVSVGSLHYKGPLSDIALNKYGPRENQSEQVCEEVLARIQHVARDQAVLVTDEKNTYPALLKKYFPNKTHIQVSRDRSETMHERSKRQNKDDRMFWLNFTAASIRHNLSRMHRKVWITTKKTEHLLGHLALYVCYFNKYAIKFFQ